jgi:undecaprenyl-diphosphatase
MELWHSLVLSIVEGITEFLPISSTGHLILAGHFLQIPQTEFLKSFNIVIQLGAILAVVVLYWRRLLTEAAVIKRVAAAFVPTAVLGLIFYKIIKQFLLGSAQVVIWALFLGGIFLIIFEKFHKESPESVEDLAKISLRNAFLIGVFQSVAMVPGVSRSAATIIGGLALGLKRKTIVEFSFLLAVPTMAAATALDLLKSAGGFTAGQFGSLAVGFVVSFLVAIAAIKFLLHFIKNHTFVSFGVYRVLIAVIAFFVLG